MNILQPPKTPFKISLYLLVFHILFSILWMFTGFDTRGTDSMTLLLFGLVGYVYPKVHGAILTYGHMFKATLYFYCYLFLLNVLPGSLVIFTNIGDIPEDERMIFVALTLFILVFFSLFHILFMYFALRIGYYLGCKKLKTS